MLSFLTNVASCIFAMWSFVLFHVVNCVYCKLSVITDVNFFLLLYIIYHAKFFIKINIILVFFFFFLFLSTEFPKEVVRNFPVSH